jgi:hypothetical protein
VPLQQNSARGEGRGSTIAPPSPRDLGPPVLRARLTLLQRLEHLVVVVLLLQALDGGQRLLRGRTRGGGAMDARDWPSGTRTRMRMAPPPTAHAAGAAGAGARTLPLRCCTRTCTYSPASSVFSSPGWSARGSAGGGRRGVGRGAGWRLPAAESSLPSKPHSQAPARSRPAGLATPSHPPKPGIAASASRLMRDGCAANDGRARGGWGGGLLPGGRLGAEAWLQARGCEEVMQKRDQGPDLGI